MMHQTLSQPTIYYYTTRRDGNDESDRSTVAHSSALRSTARFLDMYCACAHGGYKEINTALVVVLYYSRHI